MTDRLIYLLVMLVLLVSPTYAQESVGVAWGSPTLVNLPSPWLSTLRAAAAKGDSNTLAAAGREFIDDLKSAGVKGPNVTCCDLKTQYVLLLFTSYDSAEKPALVQVLLHDTAPSTARLPGLKDTEPVIEVFLAEDTSVSIQGAYEIERAENPAVKQLGDFSSAVLGKLALPGDFNLIKGTAKRATLVTMSNATDRTVRPQFAHGVTVGQVKLPYKRAKMTVKHAATVTRPVAHARARVQAVAAELIAAQALQQIASGGNVPRVSFDDVDWRNFDQTLGIVEPTARTASASPRPNADAVQTYGDALKNLAGPPCLSLIQTIAAALTAHFDDPACRFAVADQVDCFKNARTKLAKTLTDYTPTAQCTADDAVIQGTVFGATLAAIGRVTGTTSIVNQPLDRISYGLSAGFFGDVDTPDDKPRVQLQSGKLAPSPFGRLMTMAVVNLPLWGYDSSTFSPAIRERIRPFVGIPFSPNFGVALGGSFAFSRSIALNAGVVSLRYDTMKENDKFDELPGDKAHPFDVASAHGWFLAAGYALK